MTKYFCLALHRKPVIYFKLIGQAHCNIGHRYHVSVDLAIPEQTIPYGIVLYRIISYHIISYHIISYHIISYHIIPYHIISYHTISYHTISYHTIPYHIISHQITSYIIPYRVIPHHTLPYMIYRIIYRSIWHHILYHIYRIIYHIIWHHTPHHTTQCHVTWYHLSCRLICGKPYIIPYHITSYHIIIPYHITYHIISLTPPQTMASPTHCAGKNTAYHQASYIIWHTSCQCVISQEARVTSLTVW